MKHGEKSDVGAEMFGIGRNAPEGLGGGAKEGVVNDLLILSGNGGNAVGQGENHMEIGNRQKLGLMPLQPLSFSERLTLRAVTVAARVVADPAMATVVALIDVAAENGRSTHLDGMHDASLLGAHAVGIALTIGGTMQTEDVGKFELRPVHGSAAVKLLFSDGPALCF